MADPDRMQELVANNLGLEVEHPWSAYPDFVHEAEFEHVGDDRYAARMIERPMLELLADAAVEADE